MTSQLFGKYEFLKKLATGGMAEVFLARQRGIEGFSKMCVVKRILPHLAEDPEFVQMFLNEAKIAARFNHPNIAQIYELGEINGSYFIAMEFIHGEDLGRVMRKAWSTGQWIARQLAMRIIIAACEGLYYAHTKTDEQSRPLKVVHRDISPQNLLISFDGSVKVVDFGIAKAADSGAMTKSGAIKGKFAYMAPEQAAGKALDHRSDIFAIGLVLYELITGVRPLKRDSELGTLQAALECDIAPPSQVADVPSDLDDLVMRALTKNAEDRYENARQFGQALEEYLVDQRMVATPVQISELMHTLFADRLAEEAKLGHPDPQIANDPMFSQSLSVPASEPSSTGKSKENKTTAQDMSWEAPPAQAAHDVERSNGGEKSMSRSGPRTMAKSGYRAERSGGDSERTVLPPPDVQAWDAPSAVMPAPKRSTGETRVAPEENPRRPSNPGTGPGRTTSGANVPRARTGDLPVQARRPTVDDEGTILEDAGGPPRRSATTSGPQQTPRPRKPEPDNAALADLEDIEPIRTPTGRRNGGAAPAAPRKPSRPEANRIASGSVEDEESVNTSEDLQVSPKQKRRDSKAARAASSAPKLPRAALKLAKPIAGAAFALIAAGVVMTHWGGITKMLSAKAADVVQVDIQSNQQVSFSVVHAEPGADGKEELLETGAVLRDTGRVHPGDTIVLRNSHGAHKEFVVKLAKGQKVFKQSANFKMGTFVPQITAAKKVDTLGLELWLNNQKIGLYMPGASITLVEGDHILEIRSAHLKKPVEYPVTVKAGGSRLAKAQDITPWLD